MSVESRLTDVFNNSHEISLRSSSKFVIMSDCHRGDGSFADHFANNQNVYFSALNYYYKEGFAYIELGDGDELWENRSMSTVLSTHDHVFWLLSMFHREDRLHMLYGNHDIVKKYKSFCPSLPNLHIHEGLILRDVSCGNKLFLVHGHQGDVLNDTLWRLARFLVRYIWKPLQMIGVQDPTSTSKNEQKKGFVERKIIEWSQKHGQLVIAGHTHRPAFPKAGDPLYFNDGSCVHPRCITAIEIVRNRISLVKWSVQTRTDRTLYVDKDILEGPVELRKLWNFQNSY